MIVVDLDNEASVDAFVLDALPGESLYLTFTCGGTDSDSILSFACRALGIPWQRWFDERTAAIRESVGRLLNTGMIAAIDQDDGCTLWWIGVATTEEQRARTAQLIADMEAP